MADEKESNLAKVLPKVTASMTPGDLILLKDLVRMTGSVSTSHTVVEAIRDAHQACLHAQKGRVVVYQDPSGKTYPSIKSTNYAGKIDFSI